MSCTDPTLVILPGLDGTGNLSQAFAGGDWGGRRVVVLPLPKKGPQDYPALAQHLREQLPEGPLVLIGESFTGPLAMRLAAGERGRVDALILSASFCRSPAPAGLSLVPLRPLLAVKPPAPILRHFLTGKEASDEAVAAVASAVREVPARTLSERVRVVLALEERECPSPSGLPVLILQARGDALLDWEAQSGLERHFPEARSTWIQGPHLLLTMAPDACREAVKAFLGQL